MNKESFSYLVAHPDEIGKNDLEALEQIARAYPYFQLAHTLVAKGYYHFKNEALANEKISHAAAYSINRNGLRKIITEQFSNDTHAGAQIDTAYLHRVKERVEAQNQQHFKNEELLQASLSHEESLLESIARRQQQQLDIINTFIEKDPGLIRTSKSQLQHTPQNEDLAAPSTQPKHVIITENYAKILTMQGKFQKAIEVYQKLILKFPEKKAYFAEKIREIQ